MILKLTYSESRYCMKSKHYLHGGDLDLIADTYHLDRNSIWDFSGNINPLGISPKAREALQNNIDLIATYPDRSYKALKNAIGTYCGIDPQSVILGNGSTELIAMTIKALKPKKALVLGPTYSEYERELSLVGGACVYYPLWEEQSFQLDVQDFVQHLEASYDMLILCNPNNPTSTGILTEALLLILEHAKKLNIFTMIDETYIEFCDDPALYSAVSLTNEFEDLLVLRGFSKFFSAPGLRVGYGLSSNEMLKTSLRKLQNPWHINSLAAFGVQVMLADSDYIIKTHALIVSERKRMIGELSSIKALQVFMPIANFVLLKLLDTAISSEYLLNKLIEEKLLIRDASSFPFLDEKYIRFCFLNPEQNNFLLSHLKAILL